MAVPRGDLTDWPARLGYQPVSTPHDSQTSTDESARRYRLAGLIYFGLAMVIVVLTVADPALAAPERRSDIIQLIVGIPFIAAFAYLVANGGRVIAAPARWLGAAPERAARIGNWLHEKLVMVLTFTSIGRFLFYLANGLGHRPRLRPEFGIEAVPASPKMMFAAVLMAVIVVALARASWVPFLGRLFGKKA